MASGERSESRAQELAGGPSAGHRPCRPSSRRGARGSAGADRAAACAVLLSARQTGAVPRATSIGAAAAAGKSAPQKEQTHSWSRIRGLTRDPASLGFGHQLVCESTPAHEVLFSPYATLSSVKRSEESDANHSVMEVHPEVIHPYG